MVGRVETTVVKEGGREIYIYKKIGKSRREATERIQRTAKITGQKRWSEAMDRSDEPSDGRTDGHTASDAKMNLWRL